jgi:hypothetical protein
VAGRPDHGLIAAVASVPAFALRPWTLALTRSAAACTVSVMVAGIERPFDGL